MKIIIAPDSFKESLSAAQVATTIKAGFLRHFPDADYVTLPIADGGEGTLDALISAKNGQLHSMNVSGPLGNIIQARWGHFEADGQVTAVIELAEASGLALVAVAERNIHRASTYGTGELIKAALDVNVDRIILCLGGSATNDAGAGIAQALGVKFLDGQGQELPPGGLALNQLSALDFEHLHPRAKVVEWILACDVTNPLCGQHGASAVFGPQKGANADDIIELDAALAHFSQQVEQVTGINHSTSAGFGAAGGTPLAISMLTSIQLKPGVDIVLDAIGLAHHMKDADLVITGEGQMDFQTLFGKAPFGVAKRAKDVGIPTIAIAGSLGSDLTGLDTYFSAVFGTVRSPQPLQQVLKEAPHNLFTTASNIAALLKINLF